MSAETRRISILPPLVAERIAAGEVIERPSSVVKELLENSLDAGATEVAVILENGGKSVIEVLDNGHGMGPSDLGVCIQRHATSKLKSIDDLEKIKTLGFRGEALPSVAAVSELSLLSRSKEAKDSDTAYELVVNENFSTVPPNPEAVTFGHFLGSPHGTRIRARGLFSQVPARLKFLKSQGAEVSQVREWMERLALTHPHVGFKLVSDDRTVMNLRPQDEASRVKALLGDGEDYPVISKEGEGSIPGLKIRAYWLQGLSTPQMRRLVQVVNRRAVRDRMLQQALLSPFRQALLPGQFPAAALFIEVDPGMLDVNVHPTKTEIRFLESSKVFRSVESLVERMIEENGAPAFAAGAPQRAPFPGATPGFVTEAPMLPSQQTSFLPPASATTWRASDAPASGASAASWGFSRPTTTPAPSPSFFSPSPASPEADVDLPANAPETPTMIVPQHTHPLQAGRFSGIIFNTYMLYDLGEELGLVDQHAAHERVRYEKLRKRAFSPDLGLSTQVLLLAEVVHFPVEARATVEARLEWLNSLGFEVELFGEEAVVFRGVPSEWGTQNLKPRLKSLIERLTDEEATQAPKDPAASRQLLMDENLFEKLASEACHSAVRAGDRLEPEEASALLDELFRCEHPWNCPHGRPTVVRVPRARFEEWFQRRV